MLKALKSSLPVEASEDVPVSELLEFDYYCHCGNHLSS